MTEKPRSGPSVIPALVALAALIGFGYYYYQNQLPTRTEHLLNPPIEIIDPKQPLTIIEDTKVTTQDDRIDEEAELFIQALTPAQSQSVIINEHDDQFVRHDASIQLPNDEYLTTTLNDLINHTSIAPDTAITLQYNVERQEKTTLAELSDRFSDHTIPITIMNSDDEQQTKSLFEWLNTPDIDITAPITVLSKKEQQQAVLAKDLNAITSIPHDQMLTAIIHRGTQELNLKDIINNGEMPDNALFYLHRVTKDDQQGLWGIIQTGLIEKFRTGVHIEGIKANTDTVSAIIPADADEKLASGLSSFLGKILNDKVTSSYIYNFSSHVMTQDPNRIYPGQQLIMIHFTNAELTDIYRFFSDKRASQAQSFAID